jgi:predicted DNA-binding transcriptional regulator AlpA
MAILLRTTDAAKHLGVSTSYLEKRRHAGLPPRYIKLGRTVAYREGDLIAWIESNARQSTSESPAAACAA